MEIPLAFVTLVIATSAAVPPVPAAAQELPRGEIIDAVTCVANPNQSYALYIPTSYSPTRPASLLVAFHPAARGRAFVETYRDAAEMYGYIVAGSNNSRNGPWQVSADAVNAVLADLDQRMAIDPRRLYMTGHSGGARVAMQVALATNRVAGVIASSAGYPDSQPRKAVPFVVFGTAGTEDFNYLELRQLDRTLTTPHRVVIFEGGHTLPPPEVATEAIEWLELQAMKSGLRPRDPTLIDRLFDKRRQALARDMSAVAQLHVLNSVVTDFDGLHDVAEERERATELSKLKDVKKALDRERSDDESEVRLLGEVRNLEAGLRDEGGRTEAFGRLRATLLRLSRQADATTDSNERRRARRLLRAIVAGATERVLDSEYLKLLQQYRRPSG